VQALVGLAEMLFVDEGLGLPPVFGYAPPIEKASPLLASLLEALDRICDLYDLGDAEGLDQLLARTYERFRSGPFQGRASLIGHAHLDLVWLWPEEVTRRKGAHTCASMLRLMDRYPEFRFLQSQPYLNRHFQNRFPGLQ
jgi:alpha-mannosidase